MTDIDQEWRESVGYADARFKFFSRWANTDDGTYPHPFEQSEEYRNARLAFKKRTGGHTKGDH